MAENLSSERIASMRGRYCRLVVANHDLLEARAYLLDLSSFDGGSARASSLKSALLTAFVVSYGRCFTESQWTLDKKAVLLPAAATKDFSAGEQQLHKRLVALRMQEFAHSDVTAADVSVAVGEHATLIPVSRVMRHYSLRAADFALSEAMISKLVSYVTAELIALQAMLAPHGEFSIPRPPAEPNLDAAFG